MKKLRICSKRSAVCRKGLPPNHRHCKGAYAHKCGGPYQESHGCSLYISQPFCVQLAKDK